MSGTGVDTQRIMVFRIPDWSIHAYCREKGSDPGHPIALISKHFVVGCSAAARAEGVRIGLREREAMQRCPDIEVGPYEAEIDERRFAPVFATLTGIVPQVEPLRPGLVAMRARGPARYYGSEVDAAEALLVFAREAGFPDARVGVADGRFAAEQAAREQGCPPFGTSPVPGAVIVEPGRSPAFLDPLPVSRAADGEFAALLSGLGIHTLGAFAGLPEASVRARFGAAGVAAHRRASGVGPAHGDELRPRRPVRQFTEHIDFEPPLDSADQLAFACSGLAERVTAELAEERLVCTELRVSLVDDTGMRHERDWAHPHHFSPADVIARIRWQAAAMPRGEEGGEGAGIASVRIAPIRTDRAAAHEPGLWNSGPDERVHHHLSRAQSLLGHEGVTTAALGGGRLLHERQRFTPWGSAPRREATAGPWPGALPDPRPSLVYDPPLRAELTDGNGSPVSIDSDDLLTAAPAALRIEGREAAGTVRGWSPPWPIRERWWEGRPERFRIQVELTGGAAWLLLHERRDWFAEGRYD